MILALTAVGGMQFHPPQANAHSGATGIVKERMDRFKNSQQALKAIGAALKSGDLAAIDTPAASIAIWADEMLDYFPAGSNPPPSEALDVIWSDPTGFASAGAANAAAAKRLQTLAASGDGAASMSAFKDLAATCKACHQKYRQ